MKKLIIRTWRNNRHQFGLVILMGLVGLIVLK